ncbi:MAG: hypothetical protein JNM09_11030 [Blastocatellia bacterium]|nr:hypothetical protein [Blastocatellia bacterium]
MRSKHTFKPAFFALLFIVTFFLQSVCAQSADEFKFINAQNTATLEKELNLHAANGWRLFQLPKALQGNSLGALLSRPSATDKPVKYEYKVLAARRIGTLQDEFKAAISQGYEFRSIISLYRAGDVAMDYVLNSGGETMILLERPQGETKPRFEYQFLSVKLEGTLQKELAKVVAQGYRPMEMVRAVDNSVKRAAFSMIVPAGGLMMRKEERTLITVRELAPATNAASNTPKPEYKFLATKKVATMEEEMNAAAKEGFRYHSSSPGLLTLMIRDTSEKSAKQRYEYKLLATLRTDTMQKEMQEMAEKGFNYLSTSSGLGGVTTLFERDLEKPVGSDKKEYRLLAAITDSTTEKEIAEAISSGYQFRDITRIGEFIVVLDRPRQ